MQTSIKILKFGSSVLRSESDLPRVVHEIYRHWRKGSPVLAVVSAFGTTTDELLRQAKSFEGEPQPSSLAALLATGEATSAALLGLAVHRAGIPVKVLSPEQVGLQTNGDTLDAEPFAVNVERLQRNLQNGVVIISGFVGTDAKGDLTLLGRGGSDFTALFLAEKLGGHCILIKDVAGLFESNPNEGVYRSRRFARANWKTAGKLGGEIVQSKAARFARKHELNFSIAAIGANVESEIYGGADEFAPPESIDSSPLRVALLGCGTVGGGVYRRLAELPEFFTITGVAVNSRSKARTPNVPEHLVTTDAKSLIEEPCDVVIELIGGTEIADEFVTRALTLGRHVVTANKALLAGEINRLETLALTHDSTIRYSAAVGGAMPAIEAVSQAGKFSYLRSFSGILNGTCNFICCQMAAGNDFKSSVEAAQKSGFAEADAEHDLNGTDAAQKLILLARTAFGVDLPFEEIRRTGIENLDAEQFQKSKLQGRVIRLVAECHRTKNGFEASVKPVELPASHPFAQTVGAENCLLLETNAGETQIIKGKGAGRWATTEAVIADLFELRREIFLAKPQSAAAKAGKTEVYV